jgi:selina-4(15),7(11)-diene synthase
MRDRIMTLHLRLRDTILAGAPPEQVAMFASTVGYIIRGNIEWSATTHRYSHPEHPANKAEAFHGTQPLTWADQPSDPSTQALPIAALAPWWD